MKDQEKREASLSLQSESTFNALHLGNLPFPVLVKIFQNLAFKDQISLYLTSRVMWEIKAKQIVFNSNKQIEKFLISYEVLTQEELDKIYRSDSSTLIEQIIEDYKETLVQDPSRLYNNFLAVKSLNLDYFIIKKELLEILTGVFPNLEDLVFTGNAFNRSVETPILPSLKLNNLTRLELQDKGLTDISLIPQSLQTLELACERLINIEPLTSLKGLKELTLYHLESTVLHLPLGLEKLTLVQCTSITDFSILSKLGQLEELRLLGSKIQDLSLLPIQKLKKLSLEFCEKITDASHLAKAEKLEWLKLDWLSITHLSSLPSGLKYFELTSCRKITDFEFLKSLEELKILRLRDMRIIDISALPKQATELSLSNCRHVKDFTHLANLKELRKLTLSYTCITDLSVLPNTLEELSLRGCENIKFCPQWLKEKITSGSIKIIGYNAEELLAMPNPLSTDLVSTLVDNPNLTSIKSHEQSL